MASAPLLQKQTLLLARFDLALTTTPLDKLFLRLMRHAHHFLERIVHALDDGVFVLWLFLFRSFDHGRRWFVFGFLHEARSRN